MTRLPVLCPQEYDGGGMRAVTCTRCYVGWDRSTRTCKVKTGAEGMKQEPTAPECPIRDRCQHGIQAAPGMCAVRASGQVCESALRFAGWTEDEISGCEYSFNADFL